jgi:TPR repeat protein
MAKVLQLISKEPHNITNLLLIKEILMLNSTMGAAEQKTGGTENSFGICLGRGIGVQKNFSLAAQYYARTAQHGHPDGAAHFGFCVEHGQSIEQTFELATEDYRVFRGYLS